MAGRDPTSMLYVTREEIEEERMTNRVAPSSVQLTGSGRVDGPVIQSERYQALRPVVRRLGREPKKGEA